MENISRKKAFKELTEEEVKATTAAARLAKSTARSRCTAPVLKSNLQRILLTLNLLFSMTKDLFLEKCASIFDEAQDSLTSECVGLVIAMVSETSEMAVGLDGSLTPDDCLRIAVYVDDIMVSAHELLTLPKELPGFCQN